MKRIILITGCTLWFGVPCLFGQNKLPSSATLQSAAQSAQTPLAKAEALNRLSEAYLLENNTTAANTAAADALESAQIISAESEIAQAHDNLGKVCRSRLDYGNAMKHFIEAARIRENQGDKPGAATSKHLIGSVFYLQGDLDNALKNLKQAYDQRSQLGNSKALAETNRTLGDVYLKRKVFGEAQEHYRAAIDGYVEAQDLESAAEIAGLLGDYAAGLGDSEGALVYYRQAFDLHSGTENTAGMGRDYLKIGEALLHQQLFEEAYSSFETAEGMFAGLKDTLGMASAMKLRAAVALQRNAVPEAQAALGTAFQLLHAAHPAPGFPEQLESVAGMYRDMGDFTQAYACLNASNQAKETVFGFEKNKALLELTTRFQSELAAEEQKRTITQLSVEQSAARKVRVALLAVLALSALALWALWNRNRIKKRDNLLLKTKNDEIDQRRKELAIKNARLDELNQKLVAEIAERELMEKNAFAKDKFLAVMSREMRTPMSNLLSITRQLLENKPKNDQVESLHQLQFNANNLLVFINDMLDFSKIETGKIVMEQVEFDPKKIISEVHRRFSGRFAAKNAVFSLSYDEQIPARLLGDPAHFSQIMSNLIASAYQSDDSREVMVKINIAEKQSNTCVLQVEVNDSGSGITALHWEAVKNMSLADLEDEQAANALGLAIAKRLTDLHHGHFEAKTQDGKGATLTVKLPYVVSDGKVRPENMKPEMLIQKLQGKRVLVAEDNRINQLVVSKMLQKTGIVVTTADDGAAAVEAFNRERFDLVLMDIQMPKLDGYRATAEMRKNEDPAKQTTPIIALTASAYLTDKDKAALFQMDDHIGKPFSPEELMERVIVCLIGN